MKKIFVCLMVLFVSISAFAQMPGWTNIKPVLVKENSGNQLINYQLKLVLNTSDLVTAGQMLSSGDDIRFTSECTGGINFNYWIESGMNTTNTTIWVKVDTIPANGARTIYIQYGNSGAAATSAVNGTFIGPQSSTDSVDNGAAGGVGNSQRGFRFYPNEDILVTAFGKREPTGTPRYITLFDYASQAIVYQSQVSGPAAQYSYQDIAAPIWLTQGTQYLLEMYQDATDGYYFGTSSQIGQQLTYIDMRYCNGCDQNTFPQNYLNSIHYGYPDFWYYSKNNVSPAPTVTDESFQLDLLTESFVCFRDSIQLNVDVIGSSGPYSFAWTNNSIEDSTLQSPIVSPADTLEYFVDVTDACGVIVSGNTTINVGSLPNFNAMAFPSLICNGETAELTVDGDYDYLWSTSQTNDTISVSPGNTTFYTVTATDSLMCQQHDTVEVAVNAPIMATYNVDICANESLTVGNHVYTVSGTYIDTLAGVTSCDSIVTHVLTVNSLPVATHYRDICFGQALTVGNHTYAVPGSYIDTLSGGSGCDSIITTVLTIEADIDVDVQLIGLTCVADLGGDFYQWVDCNNGNTPISGATNTYYEATVNGSYAVEVTLNNCTKTSSCLVVSTVGIEEESLIENIAVYPNPSTGVFNVTSSISQAVLIVDAIGNQIMTQTLSAGQSSSIDLTLLSGGIYFLKSKTKIVRLVIE